MIHLTAFLGMALLLAAGKFVIDIDIDRLLFLPFCSPKVDKELLPVYFWTLSCSLSGGILKLISRSCVLSAPLAVTYL